MIHPALAQLMLHLRSVVGRHMQAPEAKGLHHVLLVFSSDGRIPAVVGIASDLEKFDEIEGGVLNTLAHIRAQVDAGQGPPPPPSDPGNGTPGQSN